ncbi:sensor histidine kinase [Marinobacterium lutimaris]|uniref:C4-dicarboxylate transport sensor protein DctB n=1 Tax=Marinobacterium lutimaris TaxID=568106 RepID=A0A1H5X5L5_9GAMM|nr:ATP-binding protein [Marinobacterium lutimaris]SEG07039.1 PAS domain S-box-containing protein [Marinobacterium lutimaris]
MSFRPLVLMTLYLVCVLVLTLVAGMFSRNWALDSLHDEASDRLLSNVTQLRTALDQYRYLPFVLTQSREVRTLLRLPDADVGGPVDRYLEQINLVAGSSALLVLDLSGWPQASSNWRDQQELLASSQSEKQYFQQAISGHEGREFVQEGRPARAALYLSAPIYDQQDLIGVAAMRLELDKLHEQLPIDYPFLIADMNGKQLFSMNMPATLPSSSTEVLGDGTQVHLLSLDDNPYLMHSVVLDDLQWRVSVLVDARSVGQQQRIVAGSIAGAGFALGLLILYLREKRQKRALQREQARERVLNQERQQDMISTAQVGLINIDAQGIIHFINPMATQLFGVTAESMRDREFSTLIVDDAAGDLLRETLSRLHRTQHEPLTNVETIGQRGDGSLFPMMVSVRGMAHHPELGYLVTVIDISRRKRLEQALREANESLEHKVAERTRALEETQAELVQAGKLAALGRMSAQVVHELNQPLTAIRTYLAIGRRQLENPQMQADNYRQLESLIDRMALITGQLKTFAYKKPEALAPVPVGQSIDQVLGLFRGRFAEMNLQLCYDPPGPDVQLSGDQARFEQVLINLVKNACDAMQGQEPPHRLTLLVSEVGEDISLRVEDNGPGIDAEHREQLFEPFFTTKEVGTGLGLGLAIVHSIVRDLGGDIHVGQGAEGGACFEVTFKRFN